MAEGFKHTSRKALGEFIKTYRAKISPHDKGLSEGFRRRTPGLRREELAQLCGISSTWLTWIEQGRPQAISVDTLDRLATTLELNRTERAYLFTLAQKKDPYLDRSDESIPSVLEKVMKQIRGPAYVLDKTWNAVIWNRSASILFKDWLHYKNGSMNLLRFMLYNEKARVFITDWEIRIRRLIAEFRADSSQYPDDPEIQSLIQELNQTSPEFRKYWGIHEVIEREGGLRTFNCLNKTAIKYEQITLRVSHRPQLKLIILVPVP